MLFYIVYDRKNESLWSLFITHYSLLITRYYSEYKHPINRTNLRICRRLIRSRFIRTSHVKSQPITSKYFVQEYNFFRANQ